MEMKNLSRKGIHIIFGSPGKTGECQVGSQPLPPSTPPSRMPRPYTMGEKPGGKGAFVTVGSGVDVGRGTVGVSVGSTTVGSTAGGSANVGSAVFENEKVGSDKAASAVCVLAVYGVAVSAGVGTLVSDSITEICEQAEKANNTMTRTDLCKWAISTLLSCL